MHPVGLLAANSCNHFVAISFIEASRVTFPFEAKGAITLAWPDNVIICGRRIDPVEAEARGGEKAAILLLGAFFAAGQDHHRNINGLSQRRQIPFGQEQLHEQERAILGNGAAVIDQDFMCALVIPIVDHASSHRPGILEQPGRKIAGLHHAALSEAASKIATVSRQFDNTRQVGQNAA